MMAARERARKAAEAEAERLAKLKEEAEERERQRKLVGTGGPRCVAAWWWWWWRWWDRAGSQGGGGVVVGVGAEGAGHCRVCIGDAAGVAGLWAWTTAGNVGLESALTQRVANPVHL